MDSKRIELLLERYWNCVSTLEEEAELREYYSTTEEIPEHLKQAAPLFRFFNKETEIRLDDPSFEERVLKEVKSHQQPTIRVRKMEQSFQNYMKVAAAIVIVIATSFIFRMEVWKGDKPELLLAEDTYKNPEEAYAETKKALMLIASKMNSGKKEVEKISILSKAESKVKGEKQ